MLIAAATSIGATAWAGDCAAVDVVVARGTDEPGALGSVIGDPLYDTLAQRLPVDSSAYAVRYPANLAFPTSVAEGVADMYGHITAQAARCHGQRFVLVGYSQGALVTHGVLGTVAAPAIATLPPSLAPSIVAVLLFGDPLRAVGWQVPAPYSDNVADYCTGGDAICGGGLVADAHTAYGWAMEPAASFAADRI
ncbi:cutinase family protein [Nocardia arizonensis]|uniref:cutinase family protein n=1 Tax=Nocardia arizonensis TaxID=1141647 RepID=UPI001EF66B13|nr:cutinase family protein [Nocardia arizonensis]